MNYLEKNAMNVKWNPIPLAYFPIYTLIILLIPVIFLVIYIQNIIIYIIIIIWLVIINLMTIPFIYSSYIENINFLRKSFKAEPMFLIMGIEKFLKKNNIKFEKKINESKILKGYSQYIFRLNELNINIILRTTNQFIHIGPLNNKNKKSISILKRKIDEELKDYEYESTNPSSYSL